MSELEVCTQKEDLILTIQVLVAFQSNQPQVCSVHHNQALLTLLQPSQNAFLTAHNKFRALQDNEIWRRSALLKGHSEGLWII